MRLTSIWRAVFGRRGKAGGGHEVAGGHEVGVGHRAPDPDRLPSLVLAYLGDAVYELYVRTALLDKEPLRPHDLHDRAVGYVRAEAQALALRDLEPTLSPAERAVVTRGRNARAGHLPKGAEVVDYRYSTGFEALIGYLYLSGQEERLADILRRVEGYLDRHPFPREMR